MTPKIIITIGLAVAIGLGQGLWLKATYNKGYKAGVVAEAKKHQEAFDKSQQENAKQSAELRQALTTYAEAFESLRIQRVAGETKIIEKIEERLVTHPNCEIDPAVIRLRNEVRAQ